LRKKAGVFKIVVRASQVNFVVGNVEIAAADNFLFLSKAFFKEMVNGTTEVQLVVEAFQGTAGVGEVSVDKGELGVLGNKDAAFLIKALDFKSVDDLLWLWAGIGSRTGIARAKGGVEVAIVVGGGV